MGDEPAFPVECQYRDGLPTTGIQTGNTTGWEPGLTKREHFAAMAMQGLLSNSACPMPYKVIARDSVIMADELLLELSKAKGGD